MAIDLYRHNSEAYYAAVQMMAETKKAAIVHPTGTGKSFIAFKLCEENPDKTICWLSPSEYIFNTQLENLQKVSNGYVPQNIKFYTYAKLMNLSDDELAEICPNYIILDEFHRCGAEMWGQGVRALLSLYKNVPILGLSATAIRYLDNQRDMADELFDGNVASEMTLGEAIVKGILNPPKYVLSVFSYQKDLERYEKRVRATKSKVARDSAERYLEALRRALEKAEGLDVVFKKHMTKTNGKYIVFCANFDHMQSMIEMVPDWFSKIDKHPNIYSAYSNDPETSQAFADFKSDSSDHLKLLFCIDMLNEGVHVDDINGVILLRPTVSPIIYKQQIGRALSANKKTNAVIFDIVLNIENLYSIGAIEDEMQITTTYYRSLGLDEEIVNEHFNVVDEIKDCISLFEKLNDTLTASWSLMYKHAKAYYEENGHLEISSRYRTADGYSLGQWIFVQRSIRKGQTPGELTGAQIEKLDAIGMIWESVTDLNWVKNFTAAKTYFEENGNLDVSSRYITKDGVQLGSWLANIRTWERSGAQHKYLTDERKKQLEEIGMIWSKLDYYWEKNFAAACNYYRENGHLKVPSIYVTSDGVRLGSWISKLRALRDGKKMRGNPPTPEQIERLDSIGMVWTDNVTNKWEAGVKEAEIYMAKNGNLLVPTAYVSPSGYNLGAWMQRQNKLYRETKLSPERKSALDEISPTWLRKDPWMIRYDALLSYYKEHGTLTISQSEIVEGVWIGKWILQQKRLYDNNEVLTEEQRLLLSALPLEQVGLKAQSWYNAYDDVVTYYKEHGNLKIPTSFVGEKSKSKLADWMIRQRRARKLGDLTETQISLLNEIGFIWVLETDWEEGFRHAKEYYAMFGDLCMAQKYKCEDGYALGNWIYDCRKAHNGLKTRTVLTDEQISALEDIGMEWKQPRQKKKEEQHTVWDKRFNELKVFYSSHSRLPSSSVQEEKKLFNWMTNQRKKYREGCLTDNQLQKLAEMGLDISWLSPRPTPFEKGYAVAKKHFEETGTIDVSSNFQHKSGFWLGAWVEKLRQKRDELTSEQIAMLNEIGFIWEPTDPFEENFEHAAEYYRLHGYLPLEPKQCISDADLKICRWLRRQLLKKNNGQLSSDKISRLTAIGMDWLNTNERAWERGFSRAKAYYEENGNLNVIVSYVCQDGYPLGEWLHSQRTHRKQLPKEKINLLVGIGAKGMDVTV